MTRAAEQTSSAPARPPAPQKLRKFEAPKELAPELGVLFQSEQRIQGVCATENLRELFDAFGLQDRVEIQLPMQHMKRQHGEIWRMRVELPSMNTVDGKLVMGHQWLFEQSYPETVSGQQ
jgi:hypothetical protein